MTMREELNDRFKSPELSTYNSDMAKKPELSKAESEYFHAPANAVAATDKFPVMEIFGPTIQGEGLMIGEKTLFIRMGGCDYRCTKCDSMHAVDPRLVKAGAKWMTVEEIGIDISGRWSAEMAPWVTISGGNPAMWDLGHLVSYLQEQGFQVAVETQGSIWRDWLNQVDVLTICPKGPGMGERFNQEQFEKFLGHVEDSYNRMMNRQAVCMKSVVFSQMDFEFAVALDRILDSRHKYWPRCDRFLSLGNDHPPVIQSDGTIADAALVSIKTSGYMFSSLPEYLLWKYKILLEDYLQDPRLSHWKFLPQLHVLIWANKAGV